MTDELIPIPRIDRPEPHKNVIEWGIPRKVSIRIIIVNKEDYMVIGKVKIKKKHWWHSSWKKYTRINSYIFGVIYEATKVLNKHGYTIDTRTIKFSKPIGNPAYFDTLKE